MPVANKAYVAMLAHVKNESAERVEKRREHCDKANKKRERLEDVWKKEREQIGNAEKQEKEDAKKRLQDDRKQREDRWISKTAAHPFAVDLWQEDSDLYTSHRINETKTRSRERSAANAYMQDVANRRKAKASEVDALDNLRKERKKLQADQKDLKARLDLDKVDRRCAAAQSQADARHETHQLKLAEKGHLDRMASDVFTEERLNHEERLERIELEKSGKLRMARTDSWRPKRRFGTGAFSQERSILANSAPSVMQRAGPLDNVPGRRQGGRSNTRLSELTIDEEDPLSPKAELAASMLDQARWTSLDVPSDPQYLPPNSPARTPPGHKM